MPRPKPVLAAIAPNCYGRLKIWTAKPNGWIIADFCAARDFCARECDPFNMIAEITADGIGENQRVIDVRRHILIDHDFSVGAKAGLEQIRILIIGDGF